jgi:hypothetical protein
VKELIQEHFKEYEFEQLDADTAGHLEGHW